MKIYCICILKNEVDIIAQTLTAAAAWADAIFVYDHGSEDGTWETVQALAAREPRIEPYKRDAQARYETMRRETFFDRRERCRDGDWWCILDADEIYPESPRAFLAAVPPVYQVVWSASIQFYLTDADVARYERDPAAYADDVPVEQKIRYYINSWSEARFFRYDRRLSWPARLKFPLVGAVYPRRIPMKHYQHRSPQQLQQRIDVRQRTIRAGYTGFRHERGATTRWQDYVRPAGELDYDDHSGRFVLREDRMPPLPVTSRLPPRLVNALRRFKGVRR